MAIRIDVESKSVEKVKNTKEFYLEKAWNGELSGVNKMTGVTVRPETFILLTDIFVTQFNNYMRATTSDIRIDSVDVTGERELKFNFGNKDYCFIQF